MEIKITYFIQSTDGEDLYDWNEDRKVAEELLDEYRKRFPEEDLHIYPVSSLQ